MPQSDKYNWISGIVDDVLRDLEKDGLFPAEKTVLIEHGVDYELFSKRQARAPDLPCYPLIAGFYGSIHEWLDLGIIKQAAGSCPEWDFVFIGDVHVDISSLAKLKNVKFLGARAHHTLPRYAQHWQVSLLPFKDCEQIRACNPLKLREYMAAGKPIVSTNFPALQPYRMDVNIVQNSADLIFLLNSFIPSAFSPRNTNISMQKESWVCKAQCVERALHSL